MGGEPGSSSRLVGWPAWALGLRLVTADLRLELGKNSGPFSGASGRGCSTGPSALGVSKKAGPLQGDVPGRGVWSG